jgi:hypothetical protein
MEFYISDIKDYMQNVKLNNEINRMTYLLNKSHSNESLYFGLFIISTCIGIFICILKEKRHNIMPDIRTDNINNIIESITKPKLYDNKNDFEIVERNKK